MPFALDVFFLNRVCMIDIRLAVRGQFAPVVPKVVTGDLLGYQLAGKEIKGSMGVPEVKIPGFVSKKIKFSR